MHFQVYDLDGFLSELKINNKSVAPEFLDNLYNGLLGSDASKNSVLHLVSKIGNVACVEYILQKDPLKIYDHNSDTETPAFVAAREGRVDILRLHILKARNQDIEPIVTRSADKQNALHIAIQNHHVEVIFLLIKEIPQLTNRINESEESPLYLAAEAGYFGVVEHMLNKCKNISFQGPNGKTSLHAAATSDSAGFHLHFAPLPLCSALLRSAPLHTTDAPPMHHRRSAPPMHHRRSAPPMHHRRSAPLHRRSTSVRARYAPSIDTLHLS
ncbi:putative ankyrin repeat-containing domain-containing protein [Helianthus annuus]|nr:putative ankyrin repeat-containing domain-containing protein [Helianthus annuus]